MKRPVRPVALVILTLCALYPGLAALFQGLYPFVNGQNFGIYGYEGWLFDMAHKLGLPIWTPSLLKTLVGLAWLGGVPGLWAGDWRAYPLVLIAALGSLALGSVGPFVMGLIGLVCLLGFRETDAHQPA